MYAQIVLQYLYICLYIYIYGEREGERERESSNNSVGTPVLILEGHLTKTFCQASTDVCNWPHMVAFAEKDASQSTVVVASVTVAIEP